MSTARVVFKRNSLTLFFKSCGCRLASLRFGFEIDTLPANFQASLVRYALAKYSLSLRAYSTMRGGREVGLYFTPFTWLGSHVLRDHRHTF